MEYSMRDTPDGQVEIVFFPPTLVGTFPDREMARRVLTLLQGEGNDDPRKIAENVKPTKEEIAGAVGEPEQKPKASIFDQQPVQLPVPATKPSQRTFKRTDLRELTEEQKDEAFRRLTDGEKMKDVVCDMDIDMPKLRGSWAAHKHHLQKHMAEGGKEHCKFCQKLFTPSISSPDTCARCSDD